MRVLLLHTVISVLFSRTTIKSQEHSDDKDTKESSVYSSDWTNRLNGCCVVISD